MKKNFIEATLNHEDYRTNLPAGVLIAVKNIVSVDVPPFCVGTRIIVSEGTGTREINVIEPYDVIARFIVESDD
jgi:hypothetical protein